MNLFIYLFFLARKRLRPKLCTYTFSHLDYIIIIETDYYYYFFDKGKKKGGVFSFFFSCFVSRHQDRKKKKKKNVSFCCFWGKGNPLFVSNSVNRTTIIVGWCIIFFFSLPLSFFPFPKKKKTPPKKSIHTYIHTSASRSPLFTQHHISPTTYSLM